MNSFEYHHYWGPIRDRIVTELNVSKPARDNSVEASRRIASWFGLDYPRPMYWDKIELTDEMKQQLVKLKESDNYKFLAAVLKARNSVNEDRTDLPQTGEVNS